VLKNVGIWVANEKVLKIAEEGGCEVDREEKTSSKRED